MLYIIRLSLRMLLHRYPLRLLSLAYAPSRSMHPSSFLPSVPPSFPRGLALLLLALSVCLFPLLFPFPFQACLCLFSWATVLLFLLLRGPFPFIAFPFQLSTHRVDEDLFARIPNTFKHKGSLDIDDQRPNNI